MSTPYTAPGYGTAPKKEKKEEPPAYTPASASESAPVYSSGSLFESSLGKLVLLLLLGVLVIMYLLAFSFCLYGAIKNKNARYIALIINITLSSIITGVLIFWLYRGILASSLVWYIFAQCLFLFFQLVTTDIFAWYVQGPGIPPTPATPLVPPINCTNGTHVNCTSLYSSNSYDMPVPF